MRNENTYRCLSGFERIERWSNARFFKEDSDGRFLFFPRGCRGQGFQVSSQSAWTAIRRRVALVTLAGPGLAFVPAGLLFGLLGSDVIVLAVAAVSAVLFVVLVSLWTRLIQRNLAPTEERLSWEEVQRVRRGLLAKGDLIAAAGALIGVLALTSSAVVWIGLGAWWGIQTCATGAVALLLGTFFLRRRRRIGR